MVVVELGVVRVEQRLDTLRRGGHLNVTHTPVLTVIATEINKSD
jgi:hypothetical protein